MKDIILFKNANKQGNQPDFRMVAKDDEGNLVSVASLWTAKDDNGNPKKDKNGNVYLSGKMNDEYNENKGYKIVVDSPSEAVEAPSANENAKDDTEYPNEEDVPFF